MAKGKTHQVTGKKKEKRLVITKEQLLKMDRSARRQAQIEEGHNPASGSGVHGGDDKTRNRRDRREAKLDLRRRNYDE